MAGRGTRFANEGYETPKPLIKIKGKTIIEYALDSVPVENANFIFIVRAQHYKDYDLENFLNKLKPGCKIVQTDIVTEGQACSALLAKEHINNNKELMIVNSDNYFVWKCQACVDDFRKNNLDGVIPTFYDDSGSTAWSYAKTNSDGFVVETAEKKPISSNAIAGIFIWKEGSDFVKFSEQMIEKNIRINNEFYIAPAYNEGILEGSKFAIHQIEEMFALGNPQEAKIFEDYLEGRPSED